MMKSVQAAPVGGPTLGNQTQHFWQARDRFLKAFERFSAAWLKRRHAATQAALDTSKRTPNGSEKNPVAALSAFTTWQSDTMARLAEDGQACTEMMTHCATALVQKKIEAAEETVTTTHQAMKQNKSEAV